MCGLGPASRVNLCSEIFQSFTGEVVKVCSGPRNACICIMHLNITCCGAAHISAALGSALSLNVFFIVIRLQFTFEHIKYQCTAPLHLCKEVTNNRDRTIAPLLGR